MMKDKAAFRIAASSLIITATMVGCSGASVNKHVDTHAGKLDQMADAQAKEAEKAIGRKDAARAIVAAEAAVAASPDDAAYRALLGRAYLSDGRYGSARTSFEDAMTLGNRDSHTIVSLALIRSAQGNFADAQDLLLTHMDKLSAADYGLAMALSGNANEAVRLLSQAIHDPGATSKERQNLAYAHALAGNWVEARQVASLDLTPGDAVRRVAYWAQMAQPGAETARVIAMIGAPMREDDAGRPVRLALNGAGNGAGQDATYLADATRLPDAASQQTGDMAMLAAIEDEQRSSAPLPSLYQPSADAPVMLSAAVQQDKAPRTAAHKQAPAKIRNLALAESNVAKKAPVEKGAKPAPTTVVKGSKWVVQLGAFSSQQAALVSYKQQVKKHAALAAWPVTNSKVQIGGKPHYRVAVSGFGSQAEAQKLCASIKGQQGTCFVRQGAGEASPARWADGAGAGNSGAKSTSGKRATLR